MKSRRLLTVCVITIALRWKVGSLSCFAVDYWVAASGDDSASGTKEKPFLTTQKGVDSTRPGDTVFVRAGRYKECVSINKEKSGEEGKWVTISAAPGEERRVVVGVEEPRIDAYGSGSSAFVLLDVKYVRLRGFKCVAPYRGRGSGIGARKSQHIEVINCIVTGGGQGGIDANHCDYVTIDGVEAYFNGGGSGWSSGISLLDPKTKENVVRNCICYGNYDNSSYRSDGNGIIIDNGYSEGGALLINNLCFMNGGKGICSTRSDNCAFLNNTSAANCWQVNQQAFAHELSIRGAHNLVRNNIGVGTLPQGVGMQVLLSYGSPKGRVNIDPQTISCDHNLFFNPGSPFCVVLAGNRRQRLTFEELRKTMPNWSENTLNVDPGFVDMENLDFRLRPDSPALKAGIALSEVSADRVGKPRAKEGPCSLGCYEGGYTGPAAPRPTPEVTIAPGEDAEAIESLLKNEYALEWHGMLWGWGKLLPEELPLQVEVRGPRKADFINLSGRFVLGDLLRQISEEHQAQLILRRPEECKEVVVTPHAVSRWVSIRGDADKKDRAFVRRVLRTCIWTEDHNGKAAFADLAPALAAALGVEIESTPPIPSIRKIPMVTRNMRFVAFLNDLAQRLNVRFTLSRSDPLADAARVQKVDLDKSFGAEDGIVELTVEKPDGRGRIDIFARVQPKACLCARLFSNNSRFISPAGIDDKGAGSMYHKASTRLDPGTVARLAVIGKGCALNVGSQWVLLNQLPSNLKSGGFRVRVVSEWVKVGRVQFVSM